MIYFRADGNAVTGAGHLMRCLTIAEELNRLPHVKEQIRFLCADEASARLVSVHGMEAVVLGTDYRQMETELPGLRKIEADWGGRASVFVVDSYHVTDAYLEGLAQLGTVVLLDDLGEVCRPVDAVINYNAFADLEQYRRLYQLQIDRTDLYIGSAYVPIRRQFLNVPYVVKEQAEHVLLTTGGGDSENIAGKILEAIRQPDVHYHVVVGRFSPHFDHWRQLEETDPCLHLHYDVTDMAGLMSSCDLAVTAGGTTIYELAAIGVPFICFSYAKNQEALTRYIGDQEIAGYGGAYHLAQEETIKIITELVHQAMAEKNIRDRMCREEKKMIDGRGAQRLAECIAEYQNV